MLGLSLSSDAVAKMRQHVRQAHRVPWFFEHKHARTQVHIHGEVMFDKQQGLWFMADGWERALETARTKDFMLWLQSQHNGLKVGQHTLH